MLMGRPKFKWFLLPLLILGVVLVFLPMLGLEGYRLRLLSLIFMWVALAGCWNLMSGTTGYIDFGPVAYFGAGSYCTALLMIKGGLPFFLSLLPKPFLEHEVNCGICCCAGNWIAAESASVAVLWRSNAWPADCSAHGDSRGY